MIYRSLLRPILFRLPAETAHELAINSLTSLLRPGFARRFFSGKFRRAPFGQLRCFGLLFDNPVGLAAGFDKNGTATQALAALGFGFIEAGTVTSQPQPGNPKPRVFRLMRDGALINRLGFNNCGAAQLAENISRRRPDCVLGKTFGRRREAQIRIAFPVSWASLPAVTPVPIT